MTFGTNFHADILFSRPDFNGIAAGTFNGRLFVLGMYVLFRDYRPTLVDEDRPHGKRRYTKGKGWVYDISYSGKIGSTEASDIFSFMIRCDDGFRGDRATTAKPEDIIEILPDKIQPDDTMEV